MSVGLCCYDNFSYFTYITSNAHRENFKEFNRLTLKYFKRFLIKAIVDKLCSRV